MGRSLKRFHCKRNLVSSGKQAAYKLSGTKRSLSSLKKVPRPLLRQDNTCSTHNTTVVSYINKEGGMRSGSLCALLWRILTWCTRKQVTQSSTHSRPAERCSRQAIQAKPDHPNGVVSPSRGLPNKMQQVAPAKNRLLQQAGHVTHRPAISMRGILIAEVSAHDGGWYVHSGGRSPPRYVRNGRCFKEKSLFEEKK